MQSEHEQVREMMKRMTCLIFLVACLLVAGVYLTGCTYSITMVHTEGTASDVVDETATNSPDIKPDITIPLTP